MAALYLRLTLAILIYIRCRLRRRQKMVCKTSLSNRTKCGFQSPFLVTKELDRLMFFR